MSDKVNLSYEKENTTMSEQIDKNVDKDELIEEMTVVLTLDDDEELECVVLTIFEVNKREYIALLPITETEEDEEESDVYIYRYQENEGSEPKLDNIEDDDEYDAAADAFDEWLDMQEFDEIDE